jgi:hypothetical protein
MSDDLDGAHSHQHILHNGESYIKLADAAETCKRLRTWHTAVYNALTEWHDPPRDDEAPKDALRRLIQYEITAALDPAVSQSAADLVATARREGEAAGIDWGAGMISAFMKIADKMSDGLGLERDPVKAIEFAIARTLEDAAAIRAAAKEGKP